MNALVELLFVAEISAAVVIGLTVHRQICCWVDARRYRRDAKVARVMIASLFGPEIPEEEARPAPSEVN